jgi:gas vesicle protein
MRAGLVLLSLARPNSIPAVASVSTEVFAMKGFLAGFGFGFGVALLVAPKSGRETRKHIANSAGDVLHAGRDQARRVAAAPGQVLNAVREQASNVGEKLGGVMQQGRERFSELLQRGSGPDAALNNISREELMNVYGIGPVLADRVIGGRPYKSIDDLLERGIIPDATVKQLKRELLNKQTA